MSLKREKKGTNPSSVKSWVKDDKNLNLEIEDFDLGRVKLTLRPNKQNN